MTHLLLHDDLPGTRRVRFAASASAAAGAIHLAAAVPHFGDDILFGSGFVLVGWLQILLAVLLFRGHHERPLLAGGLVLHVGSIAAWALSRTVGLPLGHPGVEPVALPDLLTVAFEVLSVGFLVWRLSRPHAPRPARRAVLVGLLASWLFVMTGSTVAVADLGRGGHGHDSAGADHHDDAAASDHHDADAAADHEAAADHHDTAGSVEQSHGGSGDEHASSALHVHDDASLHLHATGEVHQHEDGSIHIHDAAALPNDDTDDHHASGDTHADGDHDEPTSDVPAGHDNSDGHHDTPSESEVDGHTHAPGQEH